VIGFAPIDARAKNGAAFVVAHHRTGDFAHAWWTGDMWALYCGPDYDTVEQLDFEPTCYRRPQ
jgi:hypothetical protein